MGSNDGQDPPRSTHNAASQNEKDYRFSTIPASLPSIQRPGYPPARSPASQTPASTRNSDASPSETRPAPRPLPVPGKPCEPRVPGDPDPPAEPDRFRT